jgi:hypothetical protein
LSAGEFKESKSVTLERCHLVDKRTQEAKFFVRAATPVQPGIVHPTESALSDSEEVENRVEPPLLDLIGKF